MKMTHIMPFAATAALVAGCLGLQTSTYSDVDLAPGDIHATDLSALTNVRAVKGDPIVIVKGDQALPIVYAQGADWAAQQIQWTIDEMTGVKPKMILEKKGQTVTNAPALYVGATTAAAKAGLEAPKDHVEAFRVVAKDGSFYFLGKADFAATDWCERQLGARFYWPMQPCHMYGNKSTNNIYGKCVVKTRGLAARPVDWDDRPVFAYRENWPYGGTGWNRWAKGGNSHRGGVSVHAPHGWYKEADAKDHLEIFARTADGQRATSPLLCYGNPKTLEYYEMRIQQGIEAYDAYVAGGKQGKFKDPSGGIINYDKRVVTVSQWDCGVYCSCEYCKKLLDPSLGSAGSGSPIIWSFFTKGLAKWLKEKHPDYLISCLPYVNTCTVPPGLDLSPEGNVEAMLCTMPGLAMLKNEKCKKAEEDLIRQWAKATGNKVLNWHYSCWPAQFTAAPFVYGETIQKHYSDMRDCISGTFINGGYDAPRLSLSGYVWMRCLWNPDIDVHAIYDGFATRMFGKAAKVMRELIDMQEKGWNRQWVSNQCSTKNVYEISYPRADVIKMQDMFAEAEKLAEGDVKALARIAWYKEGFANFFKESEENASGTAFPPFTMKKAVAQPVIDGKLDDACWDNTEEREYVSAYNKTNSLPWAKSFVKAVWTEKGITFGFKFMEPAVTKMNFGAPQGDPWGQDTFEIFLDCSGEGEGHYYQLFCDLNNRINYHTDGPAWSPKNVKSSIFADKDFWSVEIFVPYDDLRGFENGKFPLSSADGCVWNGNFIRWRYGDTKLPKEERVPGSCTEMSRLNTRYNFYNRDQAAFSKFIFIE